MPSVYYANTDYFSILNTYGYCANNRLNRYIAHYHRIVVGITVIGACDSFKMLVTAPVIFYKTVSNGIFHRIHKSLHGSRYFVERV